MKKSSLFAGVLVLAMLLSLSGCGWVDRARNDLNPLYFLDGALYNMEIGPSEVTIDKDGDVEDARIYLLAEGKVCSHLSAPERIPGICHVRILQSVSQWLLRLCKADRTD